MRLRLWPRAWNERHTACLILMSKGGFAGDSIRSSTSSKMARMDQSRSVGRVRLEFDSRGCKRQRHASSAYCVPSLEQV